MRLEDKIKELLIRIISLVGWVIILIKILTP